MNEVYAINAGKIKVLEKKIKDLEWKIARLTNEIVLSDFKNKKLTKIIEKLQLQKGE